MSSSTLVRRADLKAGEVLCDHCTARCCRYFAFPIDEPHSWQDFDYLRWFLLHGRASVFVDEGTWYLMVFADCRHIQEDFRCGIYQDRPMICRTYTTDNCEYDNDACYDKLFESPEQIWEYAQALLPPLRQTSADRGTALPVLASL